MAFIEVEAEFYERRRDSVVCTLCPNRCLIKEGGMGKCRGRRLRNGVLIAENYGRIASIAIDPIEKKPLYHFYPGSKIMSVGTYGCNMSCTHCQNHRISQEPVFQFHETDPKGLIDICHEQGTDSLAFTYNEPSVWYEFIRDVTEYDTDMRYVMVTNGYIESRPLEVLCDRIDAMNIDVKAFTEGFYHEVCDARLKTVLRNCEEVFRKGVHLELTYLVIPTKNDTEEEFKGFADWVCDSLSCDVPVHFTRFHPDNRMTYIGPTPIDTLRNAERIAREAGLQNVYLGNIRESAVTSCPGCGRSLITRMCGYVDSELRRPACPHCGRELYIRL